MKKTMLAAAAAAMIFLSACSGSDLNSTVFVSSMGISEDNGVYSVTVFGSAASEDGIYPVSASGVGQTPSEAVNNASRSCGLDLFLGHCEGIALNSSAIKDSSLLSEFSDSIISPACLVYFSDSPERGAEKIPADGYTAELYELSVYSRNGTPAVIPTAEDPERTAIITAEETILTDSDDSLGLMILRDNAYPRTITVYAEDGYETVIISPEASRSAYYSDGILYADISVKLNIKEASDKTAAAAEGLVREICLSAYEKYINRMGIDAVKLSALTAYNEEQLISSQLLLTVDE